MQAKQLSALFQLVRRLDDRVLWEISTVPQLLAKDFIDRAIIAVAGGERERRNTA